MKKLVLMAAVAAAALAGATVALAGGGGGYGDDGSNTTATQSTSSTGSTASSDTYAFKATLNAGQEVPHPKAPAGAAGTFTAKSTESGSTTTFRWTLKFHGLSGKAMAAHVHLGKKGKAGAVLVPLCGPCKNGQTGTVTIKGTVEESLEKGLTYVNVHTAKNAAGEIRGQIKLTGKS
jgi:hypothetical protein